MVLGFGEEPYKVHMHGNTSRDSLACKGSFLSGLRPQWEIVLLSLSMWDRIQSLSIA